MTINSAIATVADGISKLTISGVTIKDIDEIPDAASLLCPLLIPQPNEFVTDMTVTRQTVGSMGTAKIDTSYNLNYVYLHCEAGSGVNSFAPYASLISKLETILEVILANDVIAGAVDLSVQNIGNVGIITDPAGNEFWGVMLSFRILEYTQ